MTDTSKSPNEVDHWIAVNLRARREALNMSQEEVAEAMRQRGHVFSQNTVWKIETEQRQVRVAEFEDLQASVPVGIEAAEGMAHFLRRLDLPPREHALRQEFVAANHRVFAASQAISAAVKAYMHALHDLRFHEIELNEELGPIRPNALTNHWEHEAPEIMALRARIEFDLHFNEGDSLEEKADIVVDEITQRIDSASEEFKRLINYPLELPERWDNVVAADDVEH